MLDKIKAPQTLSRRGTKLEIENEHADALNFFDHVKAEVVKELKLHERKHGAVIPDRYFDEAMKRQRFFYVVGHDRPRYASASPDRPIWMHVFAFEGARRSSYAMTEMVIRADGTLNTEYLSEKVHSAAWAEYSKDEAKKAEAEVAKSIKDIKIPEGYHVEPTADGMYLRYVGEYRFKDAAKLYTKVEKHMLLPLIHAHQRWVDDLVTCTNKA